LEEDWVPGSTNEPPLQQASLVAETTVLTNGVVLDDPDGILGVHTESSYYYAEGKSAIVKVMERGKVFVSFGDGSSSTSEALLIEYLDSLENTQEIEEGARWICNSVTNMTSFDIRIVGEECFVEGLSTEGAYVAFDGHSNFGIGFAWNSGLQYIEDFLNMGDLYTGLDYDYLITHQQYDFIFPEDEIVSNPTNYENCIYLERFHNEPWMYGVTNIPYVSMQPPTNVFTTVYGSGDDRFHYYNDITSSPKARHIIVYADKEDMPELKYKWLLLDTCDSAYYYADVFRRTGSTLFAAADGLDPGTDAVKRFVEATIKGDDELTVVNSLDENYESKPYTEISY
jgi:hypothetical protein